MNDDSNAKNSFELFTDLNMYLIISVDWRPVVWPMRLTCLCFPISLPFAAQCIATIRLIRASRSLSHCPKLIRRKTNPQLPDHNNRLVFMCYNPNPCWEVFQAPTINNSGQHHPETLCVKRLVFEFVMQHLKKWPMRRVLAKTTTVKWYFTHDPRVIRFRSTDSTAQLLMLICRDRKTAE